MKQDRDINNKRKKSEKNKNQKKKNTWPVIVLLLTLTLSFIFSLVSELVMGNASLVVAYLLIIVIIIISVLFDMVGTATISCDIQPFLSMSARKVKGAKMAVKLVKNAPKVSSVCADIIGDICGIISGACGAAIVIKQFADGTSILISVLFSSLIAAITVFGKAVAKTYAVTNSNKIVYMVARVLSVFKKN